MQPNTISSSIYSQLGAITLNEGIIPSLLASAAIIILDMHTSPAPYSNDNVVKILFSLVLDWITFPVKEKPLTVVSFEVN